MYKELLITKWFFFYMFKNHSLNFFIFILISIIMSIVEVLTIASIVPFLHVILSSEVNTKNYFNFNISDYVNFSTKGDEVFFLMTIFSLILFLSSLIKIFHIYYGNYIQKKVGSILSNHMYNSIINYNYIDIINKSSSEFLSIITDKAELAKFSIFNFLSIITSLLLLISFSIYFFFIMPGESINNFYLVIVAFLIVIISTKKMLSKQSVIHSQSIFLRFKIINDTFGMMREIIIDRSQKFFKKKFKKIDDEFRQSAFIIGIISGIPKFIIEFILVLIIFMFVYDTIFIYNYDSTLIIPIVTSFVFMMYRSMPLLNNIYASFSQLSGYKESVLEAIKLLNYFKNYNVENFNVHHSNNEIDFKSTLSLENVSFKYPDSKKNILDNITLTFEKGKIYGIKGASGSGKSTFLNIISGLIYPKSGKLLVDNIMLDNTNLYLWRKKISLVSQSNFFMDETIFNNLTISLKSNEDSKINSVLKIAIKNSALDDFINELPMGLNTKIGDNAVKISGGQKQRLAIARALCKGADCLLLDESTSGIDLETEKKLLLNLKNLDKKMLIIIVSHKKQTLDFCDKIIDLDEIKNFKS